MHVVMTISEEKSYEFGKETREVYKGVFRNERDKRNVSLIQK